MAVKKPGISSDNPNRRAGRYDAVGDNDVGHRYTETDNRNVARYGSVVELAGVTISFETFQSIGIKVDLDTGDDTDHNSSVAVEYKKSSSGTWLDAQNLIRNDYQAVWNAESFPVINNFAGSIMFLTPGTSYDLRLTYSDPQGSDPQHNAVYETTVSTRAIPVKPTGGTTYYAVAGSGSGNAGTSGDPFEGIDEANAAVSAGDIVLLRDTNGTFAEGSLDTSGAEDNWVVWAADSGHTPQVDSMRIMGSHLWIDGITFVLNDRNPGTPIVDQDWYDTSAIYVPPAPDDVIADDIIVSNCNFTGYQTAVRSIFELSRWVCMDNTVVGFWPAGVGSGTPEVLVSKGIAFSVGGEANPGGPGCVLAYNSVTRHTDACDAGGDSDIYGNQIWDCGGNAHSTDRSGANVRVWGNRGTTNQGAPITFQPMESGPWYFLYNQYSDMQRGVFKFRYQDRAVMINNTFIANTDESLNSNGQMFMQFYMRNNLFIADKDPIFNSSNSGTQPGVSNYATWKTDIDYDGWDLGNSTPNFFFGWFTNTVNYSTLASWTTAVTNSGTTGISAEENGIEVDADLIFDVYTVDNPTLSLTLASGANDAVDAGILVDNLADWHGATPDLGAHQRGETALHYGPRAGAELIDKTEYWTKH